METLVGVSRETGPSLGGLSLFPDDRTDRISRAFVDTLGDSGHVKAIGTWGTCVKSAYCPVSVEASQRPPLRPMPPVRPVRP